VDKVPKEEKGKRKTGGVSGFFPREGARAVTVSHGTAGGDGVSDRPGAATPSQQRLRWN